MLQLLDYLASSQQLSVKTLTNMKNVSDMACCYLLFCLLKAFYEHRIKLDHKLVEGITDEKIGFSVRQTSTSASQFCMQNLNFTE
jgi:hypothetical protein